MVMGLVIWLLFLLYGYWFGYMDTGSVTRSLVRLHGYWYGYMVTGWLYVYLICYMVIDLVI